MKKKMMRGMVSLAAAMLTGLGVAAHAQTNFDVTTPGSVFQYFIDGTNNTGVPAGSGANNCPPLTLAAGATYTFNISTSTLHPMEITTGGAGGPHYTNADPITTNSGVMTLVIPATGFPSTLYYECSQHFFYGIITVTPPVLNAPPSNNIISILVSPTTVTLISNGTNTTYNLVPQFNSNAVAGNWQDVPSFTNTFAAGTNTTVFDRLDAICGPNVFLRISQRPP